jgi:hypothetical protein
MSSDNDEKDDRVTQTRNKRLMTSFSVRFWTVLGCPPLSYSRFRGGSAGFEVDVGGLGINIPSRFIGNRYAFLGFDSCCLALLGCLSGRCVAPNL